jgi:hypothetical protein
VVDHLGVVGRLRVWQRRSGGEVPKSPDPLLDDGGLVHSTSCDAFGLWTDAVVGLWLRARSLVDVADTERAICTLYNRHLPA